MCHKSRNNKVDHLVGNLFCKNKCKCLSVKFEMKCLLPLHLTPVHSDVFIPG